MQAGTTATAASRVAARPQVHNGVAAFPGVRFDGEPGTYTLRVSCSSRKVSLGEATLTVTVGPAARAARSGRWALNRAAAPRNSLQARALVSSCVLLVSPPRTTRAL